MTPFQSFMILKTNKQDATKSCSEVCWAGSALGLWQPLFQAPSFQTHRGPEAPLPITSAAGAEPSRGRRRDIFTRSATAARPPQHRVSSRLRFRGRARGGAGAAGASPSGHSGAVAAAATSGECPEARRAGPGPAFLLRPSPRRRSRRGERERWPLPWRPDTTSRARVGGGAGRGQRPRLYGLPGPLRAGEPTSGLPLVAEGSGTGAGTAAGEGRGPRPWVPCAGAVAAFRRRPAGFGLPSYCDGVETFLRAVIRFETP